MSLCSLDAEGAFVEYHMQYSLKSNEHDTRCILENSRVVKRLTVMLNDACY